MVDEIATEIINCFKRGNTLFIAGNGGSASMSDHFAAEFVCKFKKERKALPAISLTSNSAVLTAISNDYDYSKVFVRQLEAFSRKGDVFIALTTSGTSKNITEALAWCKNNGVTSFMLPTNNMLKQDTAGTQESHLMMIHNICEKVENGI